MSKAVVFQSAHEALHVGIDDREGVKDIRPSTWPMGGWGEWRRELYPAWEIANRTGVRPWRDPAGASECGRPPSTVVVILVHVLML
jgi:hypothetical protein